MKLGISLVLICTLLFACSHNNTPNQTIVGTWYGDQFIHDDGSSDDIHSWNDTLKFYSNGTYYASSTTNGWSSANGTYTLNVDTLTLVPVNQTPRSVTVYTLNTHELKFDYSYQQTDTATGANQIFLGKIKYTR